jgi:NADPH2:quinone reductase
MRQIVVEAFGGPEALVLRQVPEPTPPADGWLLETRAIGVNFADVVGRRGRYTKDARCPFFPGLEASGVIVAAGPRARGFERGETVLTLNFAGGCYAERIAVGPGDVLRGPAGWSFEELAALAATFGTAWYAMHEVARVRSGESALIQAAAGAVGTAAVALARSHGMTPVIGATGSADKCAFVRELGADACIDYGREDLRERVLALTGGRGVDYALESVGGAAFERCLAALAPMGRLVTIGFSSVDDGHADAIKRIHPISLFQRSISIGGLNVNNLRIAGRAREWAALVAHVEQHGLRPVIGQSWPLAEAAAAHAALEGRKTRGKVLLLP